MILHKTSKRAAGLLGLAISSHETLVCVHDIRPRKTTPRLPASSPQDLGEQKDQDALISRFWTDLSTMEPIRSALKSLGCILVVTNTSHCDRGTPDGSQTHHSTATPPPPPTFSLDRRDLLLDARGSFQDAPDGIFLI